MNDILLRALLARIEQLEAELALEKARNRALTPPAAGGPITIQGGPARDRAAVIREMDCRHSADRRFHC